MSAIFSWKGLAWSWVGLLAAAGSGGAALQLAMPAPASAVAPIVVAAVAPAAVAPAAVAPVVVEPPVAPQPAVAPPMPFQNSSLVALLPPAPPRPALRPPAPLPVPPVPPARRLARAEPHRAATVYAAAPVREYEPANWAQPMRYPSLYRRVMPYPYPGPATYFGW